MLSDAMKKLIYVDVPNDFTSVDAALDSVSKLYENQWFKITDDDKMNPVITINYASNVNEVNVPLNKVRKTTKQPTDNILYAVGTTTYDLEYDKATEITQVRGVVNKRWYTFYASEYRLVGDTQIQFLGPNYPDDATTVLVTYKCDWHIKLIGGEYEDILIVNVRARDFEGTPNTINGLKLARTIINDIYEWATLEVDIEGLIFVGPSDVRDLSALEETNLRYRMQFEIGVRYVHHKEIKAENIGDVNHTLAIASLPGISKQFTTIGGTARLKSSFDYIQKFENWTPTLDLTWENKDLSGAPYNVPANAVCEIVLVNDDTSNDIECGVRANASALARTQILQRATGGALELIRMHVQADALSIIEEFGSNTNTTIYLIGYWTGTITYTEAAMEVYTIATDNTWKYKIFTNAPANGYIEIILKNKNTTTERWAGVRKGGSDIDRRHQLHQCEGAGAGDYATMFVETNSTKEIMCYAEASDDIDFLLAGYWSTPPGIYYESNYEMMPSNPVSWEDIDLVGIIPRGSIIETVHYNNEVNTDFYCGTREDGTGLDRRFDIHRATNGGRDLVSFHTRLNSTIVDVYHENLSYCHSRISGYWEV